MYFCLFRAGGRLHHLLVPAAHREAGVLHKGGVEAEALNILVANERLLEVCAGKVGA